MTLHLCRGDSRVGHCQALLRSAASAGRKCLIVQSVKVLFLEQNFCFHLFCDWVNERSLHCIRTCIFLFSVHHFWRLIWCLMHSLESSSSLCVRIFLFSVHHFWRLIWRLMHSLESSSSLRVRIFLFSVHHFWRLIVHSLEYATALYLDTPLVFLF